MNNVQHDALLEQALDIRAARTLCRDGWSCEQINDVLKNANITHQQFETIQVQSRELDKLQKVFGAPVESLRSDHAEPDYSEIDFLNRGPDAATSVLLDKGWSRDEISLVIVDSMFVTMDEPRVEVAASNYYSNPPIAPAFPTQEGRNGYALGHPAESGGVAAVPYYPSNGGNRVVPRRRGSLGRDAFILFFMAAFALVLVFTLL